MKQEHCYAIQLESLDDNKYSVPDIEYFKTDNNDKFYHYTSVDSAINILAANEVYGSNGYFELWASQQQFLNDNEEMANGLSLIKQYFEEKRDEINKHCNEDNHSDSDSKKNPEKSVVDIFIDDIKSYQKKITKEQDIYIVCFCRSGGLLSLWKYYGGDCGVAIEFDLKAMRYSGLDIKDKDLDIQRNYSVGPYKVVYEDTIKKKIIEDIVNEALEAYSKAEADKERVLMCFWEQLFAISPLFKHKDFHEEEECRLLFRPVFSDECNTRDIIHYRHRNGIPIPYMKIKLHPRNGSIGINSIIIGPGKNQELVKKAFDHMLERKNLNIPVSCSKTPFRNLR